MAVVATAAAGTVVAGTVVVDTAAVVFMVGVDTAVVSTVVEASTAEASMAVEWEEDSVACRADLAACVAVMPAAWAACGVCRAACIAAAPVWAAIEEARWVCREQVAWPEWEVREACIPAVAACRPLDTAGFRKVASPRGILFPAVAGASPAWAAREA